MNRGPRRISTSPAPEPSPLPSTSVNDVVVHGIPSDRQVLREGDVIGIDFACYKDGYCADAARTLAVGVISARARSLLDTTRRCLERAIAAAFPGNRLGDLGAEVERCAEEAGYSVVREFVGHGIGTRMHEPPDVPNFGRPGVGVQLRPRMVIAIEPMVNAGVGEVCLLDDAWTVVTADQSLSAHFEHTVAVTENGPRVLT
jgi:methionyl aminopeptidase